MLGNYLSSKISLISAITDNSPYEIQVFDHVMETACIWTIYHQSSLLLSLLLNF